MNSTKLATLIGELNSRAHISMPADYASNEEEYLSLRVIVLEGDLRPGWVAHITESGVVYDTDPSHFSKADLEIKIKSSSDAEQLILGTASLNRFFEEGLLKFSGDFATVSKKLTLVDSLIGNAEDLQ